MRAHLRLRGIAREGFRRPGNYAGLAAALAVALIMALAAAPGLSAAPKCKASQLRDNWIRVENFERSLALYVGAIGFSELTSGKTRLPKKLAKPDFKAVDVRTADLCRKRGPVKGIRIFEASPDMIDLPPGGQTLLMQFLVDNLERIVESLPEELAAAGAYAAMAENTVFVFEDFDGNRIVLMQDKK